MHSSNIFMNALRQLLFPTDDRKFFRMLLEFSEQVSRGATIFKDFVDTYEQLSLQDRAQRAADLKEVEHRCDEMSHIIIMRLNHSDTNVLHMQSIHSLASLFATIMDGISGVSKRMLLFGVTVPNEDVQQFSLLVNNSCKELVVLLSHWKESARAHQSISRIHGIEREADYVHNLAMASLFASKRDAKEIIILKDLYDLLEQIVDNTEYASRVVENMISKE